MSQDEIQSIWNETVNFLNENKNKIAKKKFTKNNNLKYQNFLKRFNGFQRLIAKLSILFFQLLSD